jgi:hypothetical protein
MRAHGYQSRATVRALLRPERDSNAAPGLPLYVTQRPAEGPVTATRHRAGLTRHPVIEVTGDG